MVAAGAAEAGIPGVAVGIRHGDRHVVVSHGVTNVEHPLPVDGRTLFQIGSTTKTFTATAIMRLVDEGRIGLDDRVVDHLPGFRLAAEEDGPLVTVRHLLTHTCGWAGDWFLLDEPDYGRDGALARVVDDMWQAPRLNVPGEAYSYNNAGFYVLGRLLEVIDGHPYPEAVRRLVLSPAGFAHSFFYADELVTHRVAAGHVAGGDGPQVHRPWPRPFFAWPAGALCSCVDDQLAWAAFWSGDGRGPSGDQVLAPRTMALMTTPQVRIDSRTSVGLAWMVRDVGGTTVIEHGGATNGYLSRFVMRPEERFALTVLANSTAAAAFNRHVERWALARVLGVVDGDEAPAAVEPAALRAYAGRYGLGTQPAWTHELALEGDSPVLILTPGGPEAADPPPRYRLVPCGTDEVVCVEPAAAHGLRGVFGRNERGGIAWFRFGLRIYNRVSD